MDYEFDQPVRVILGTASHNVATTSQASEILLHYWPEQGGRGYSAAKDALELAMGSKRNRSLLKRARQAFVSAAAEADILMHDAGDRPQHWLASTAA
ncbi:MAG TPA: DUF982 domain-containing protein [Rhizobiaceae bacterium]|nr:DUF982 domain-containing protein [Rhizobiaceae bacterium]